ncbi:MAG TPA: hypothetical protein VNG51_02290 [Ktedonobacteraceae bacterium]|nr:hypothetical protein [Ktedonobacteraceae bacterium]
MTVALKKQFGAIALTAVLLVSMAPGWTMHVNAAMPLNRSSVSTSQMASVGPDFVCPPPPFVCI